MADLRYVLDVRDIYNNNSNHTTTTTTPLSTTIVYTKYFEKVAYVRAVVLPIGASKKAGTVKYTSQ